MAPLGFLSIVVAMTALGLGASLVQRRRHVRRLRALAAQWKLHYSPHDCFRLAPRVANNIAIPGAAALRVSDLLYGLENRGYRYLFRVDYTIGVLRTKIGIVRIGMFAEPKDAPSTSAANVIFAPESLTLPEQYQYLHDQAAEKNKDKPARPGV